VICTPTLDTPTRKPGGFPIPEPITRRGNVAVSSVNLATCWDAGRREVKEIPNLDKVLKVLESTDDHEINILQPFGKDIVTRAP
jgi:hypothetical protein